MTQKITAKRYQGAVTLNTWIEIVLIASLISSVFNLLSFIATSWALPTAQEVQVQFEGLGLWKFCLRDTETNALICRNLVTESIPGKSMMDQMCHLSHACCHL